MAPSFAFIFFSFLFLFLSLGVLSLTCWVCWDLGLCTCWEEVVCLLGPWFTQVLLKLCCFQVPFWHFRWSWTCWLCQPPGFRPLFCYLLVICSCALWPHPHYKQAGGSHVPLCLQTHSKYFQVPQKYIFFQVKRLQNNVWSQVKSEPLSVKGG